MRVDSNGPNARSDSHYYIYSSSYLELIPEDPVHQSTVV